MKKLFVIGGAVALAFLLISDKTNKIINQAERFIGQKEKTDHNGFVDSSFDSLIRSFSYFNGARWCMMFARMVWVLAYGSTYPLLKTILTNGVIQSFTNAKNDRSGLVRISSIPVVGSIVIWQWPAEPTTGHAGIVTSVNGNLFETIEGNLSNSVSRAKRNVIDSSIRLLGFIVLNK